MALRYITETAEGTKALGPYSLATVTESGIVKISGQIGISPKGELLESIEEQTGQALRNILAILREVAVDFDFSRITMVNIRLADMALAGRFNAAYAEFLGEGPYPARETIGAAIPYEGALVEITTEGFLDPTYLDQS